MFDENYDFQLSFLWKSVHIQHKYIDMNQRTAIDETRVIVMLKTVKQLKYWSQTKIQKTM